ncbi:MAG: hypothetical protein SFW67_05135 [Myxococcaceae bacterium]|nr:hypothetical protein [Myxococcaceae bacterium]
MGAWLTLLISSATGFVADQPIDAQVFHAELVIEAEVLARTPTSAELGVIEVFKGSPGGSRITVGLQQRLACDVSASVPAAGRGLWLLRRDPSGGWVLSHSGRGFYERTKSADGHAVAVANYRAVVPRAWVLGYVPGSRKAQLDWEQLVARVRALASPTPRFANARWVLQRFDCRACTLSLVRDELRAAGSIDYGGSESESGRAWQQERLIGAKGTGRSAHAVFDEERVGRTLVIVLSDGGVTEVLERSPEGNAHPFCRQPALEWQRCDAATTPGSECLEPISLRRCVSAPTLMSEEPLASTTRLHDGTRLGDWAPAGRCVREEDGFLNCVPEGTDDGDYVTVF